jgi:polysaccharide export outer membrane protein
MKTFTPTPRIVLLALIAASLPVSAAAQAARGALPSASGPATASPASTPTPAAAVATGPVKPADPAVVPPPDYVIGPEDVLQFIFWREKDLSTEGMVRPDGKISIPLLNDVDAAGLTPEELRQKLTIEAQRFVEDPTVTVVVKQINSRKVFVTGLVAKPGVYPLMAPTTVLQLMSMVGGVLEYADAKNIIIMRTENGKPANHRFNYDEVIHQKNLQQNILLRPGDSVVIP